MCKDSLKVDTAGGNPTVTVADNTTWHIPLVCPYQGRCRDYNTELCSLCRHCKETYYEPIDIFPIYPYYPTYPYYPIIITYN